MTRIETGAGPVSIDDLQIGDLLAEGGEGRVFQLPRRPELVYKAYRRPVSKEQLAALVDWQSEAVARSAAWPCRVVIGHSGDAAGLLMPRAPRRFALRHRDGSTRMASLSYLTADPAQRAAAYGLLLPPPASAERIGLLLALARLLAAFEAGDPQVGHGDLSTKNVLWSLQRGPEIFVIDCDNSELFAREGVSLGDSCRRRAMTPNWEDPAVRPGDNPTMLSDRYSLALVFLRVVGAANFPIQARQRSGDGVSVDFPVPAGPLQAVLVDEANPLWDLCARGLSIMEPDARPAATAWVPVLESLLSGRALAGLGGKGPGDVSIRPVHATRRAVPAHVRPNPTRAAALGGTRTASVAAAANPSLWPEVKAAMRRAVAGWIGIHRRALSGLRFAALCVLVDLVVAVVGLFVVAMVVSPVMGI